MDNGTKDIIELNNLLDGKDASEVKSQLKIFLLARAQREASKMSDLQGALEIMQRKYIERSMSYIEGHDDDSAILYLPEMIKNISQYLKDSGDSIKSVISNDELFDRICVVKQENTIVENVNIGTPHSLDVDSRRKVRNVLNEILKVASEDVIPDDGSKVE